MHPETELTPTERFLSAEGVTLVAGPTDSANGALDYETSADVSGGVLIALGSSGMAQGFTTASNQGSIYYNFTSQNSGTSFAVVNENGTVVASFTSPKAFQSAVVTAPRYCLRQHIYFDRGRYCKQRRCKRIYCRRHNKRRKYACGNYIV